MGGGVWYTSLLILSVNPLYIAIFKLVKKAAPTLAGEYSGSRYFGFIGGRQNSWLSTTKISWIAHKKLAFCNWVLAIEYFAWLSSLKRVQYARDTMLKYAETSTETILCNGVNTWQFLANLCVSVCLSDMFVYPLHFAVTRSRPIWPLSRGKRDSRNVKMSSAWWQYS